MSLVPRSWVVNTSFLITNQRLFTLAETSVGFTCSRCSLLLVLREGWCSGLYTFGSGGRDAVPVRMHRRRWLLSDRSPPRFSRWRVCCPEDAGYKTRHWVIEDAKAILSTG